MDSRRSLRLIPFTLRRLAAFWLLGTALAFGAGAVAAATAEEAERNLEQAEVAVAHARALEALWSTAFEALQQARRLRRSGDYAASVEQSLRAVELSRLGIAQKDYPPERE